MSAKNSYLMALWEEQRKAIKFMKAERKRIAKADRAYWEEVERKKEEQLKNRATEER